MNLEINEHFNKNQRKNIKWWFISVFIIPNNDLPFLPLFQIYKPFLEKLI